MLPATGFYKIPLQPAQPYTCATQQLLLSVLLPETKKLNTSFEMYNWLPQWQPLFLQPKKIK
jgi:hypothetical protein